VHVTSPVVGSAADLHRKDMHLALARRQSALRGRGRSTVSREALYGRAGSPVLVSARQTGLVRSSRAGGRVEPWPSRSFSRFERAPDELVGPLTGSAILTDAEGEHAGGTGIANSSRPASS
jgi:hypothetical protein